MFNVFFFLKEKNSYPQHYEIVMYTKCHLSLTTIFLNNRDKFSNLLHTMTSNHFLSLTRTCYQWNSAFRPSLLNRHVTEFYYYMMLAQDLISHPDHFYLLPKLIAYVSRLLLHCFCTVLGSGVFYH